MSAAAETAAPPSAEALLSLKAEMRRGAEAAVRSYIALMREVGQKSDEGAKAEKIHRCVAAGVEGIEKKLSGVAESAGSFREHETGRQILAKVQRSTEEADAVRLELEQRRLAVVNNESLKGSS